MKFSLEGTNVVILATHHNPSIASKEWLKQRRIIEENISKFVHAPVFSLVETDNFTFLVDTTRLQLSVKNISPENIENLPKIAERYISQLPETPYTAIGFNYTYSITPEAGSLKVIFSPNDKKFKELFSENYQLGGTIRFKFEGFIVKLNFQPPFLPDEKLNADFNFHFDSKNIEAIKKKLRMYPENKKKAEEILGGLF
jgi:hypothetical protein